MNANTLQPTLHSAASVSSFTHPPSGQHLTSLRVQRSVQVLGTGLRRVHTIIQRITTRCPNRQTFLLRSWRYLPGTRNTT